MNVLILSKSILNLDLNNYFLKNTVCLYNFFVLFLNTFSNNRSYPNFYTLVHLFFVC
ncbi:MAG: hypothetical protein QXD60_03250 [Nanopusillaceae archaeon]